MVPLRPHSEPPYRAPPTAAIAVTVAGVATRSSLSWQELWGLGSRQQSTIVRPSTGVSLPCLSFAVAAVPAPAIIAAIATRLRARCKATEAAPPSMAIATIVAIVATIVRASAMAEEEQTIRADESLMAGIEAAAMAATMAGAPAVVAMGWASGHSRAAGEGLCLRFAPTVVATAEAIEPLKSSITALLEWPRREACFEPVTTGEAEGYAIESKLT